MHQFYIDNPENMLMNKNKKQKVKEILLRVDNLTILLYVFIYAWTTLDPLEKHNFWKEIVPINNSLKDVTRVKSNKLQWQHNSRVKSEYRHHQENGRINCQINTVMLSD